jgi:hypothetical protein
MRASAKSLPATLTYTQIAWCGAAPTRLPACFRSENNSARKCLILLTFERCAFSGQCGQALDFSTTATVAATAINKVIHKKWGKRAKRCEIKGLRPVCRLSLSNRP